MEQFVIVDENSIEITFQAPLIVAQIDGPAILYVEVAIDHQTAKTPLSESSTYLVVQKQAEEHVLKLEMVYVTSTGGIKLASNNITQDEAFSLGMVLKDGSAGELVDVIILGVVSDPLFGAFGLNKQIFLDVNGGLTDDPPKKINGAHYSTPIGRALGSGSLLINVGIPLTLS